MALEVAAFVPHASSNVAGATTQSHLHHEGLWTHTSVRRHQSSWHQRLRSSSSRLAPCVGAASGLIVSRSRRRWKAQCSKKSSIALRAFSMDAMTELLEAKLPELAENVRVGPSQQEPGGYGLFAKKDLQEGDVICKWDVEDASTVMFPSEGMTEALDTDEYGALAFELLKAEREEEESSWKSWLATGVEAPKWHWMRLLLSDPMKVKEIWSSTTRGEDISAMALSTKADLEQIQGDATLEEWTRALSLAMSRCILFDPEDKPVLVLGLDMMQDDCLFNVKARFDYDTVGGVLGLGIAGETVEKMKEIVLYADRDIFEGEELLLQYLRQPHGGSYLMLYGFVPPDIQDEVASIGAATLSFNPVVSDDENYDLKLQILEDYGKSEEPLDFVLSSQDGLIPPIPGMRDEDMSEMERMVQVVRFRELKGPDCFLIDAVLQANVWTNMSARVSKANELDMCKAILLEADRWLDKLDEADKEYEGAGDDSGFREMLRNLRRSEREILIRVSRIFLKEYNTSRDTVQRDYYVDRRFREFFPGRDATPVAASRQGKSNLG